MEIYEKVLYLLDYYFFKVKNWKKLFLEGGCYWLANFLYQRIPGSYLVINRVDEHCALWVGGSIYDVRGKIPKNNFRKAEERDISFMKKNYIPSFDEKLLEEFLVRNLS